MFMQKKKRNYYYFFKYKHKIKFLRFVFYVRPTQRTEWTNDDREEEERARERKLIFVCSTQEILIQ